MIVDCHCHAGVGERISGPWDTRADLGPYLRRAARAGIDLTIVFSPFSTDYERANRRTAAIVAGGGGRLLGFACVHPERDAGRVERLLGEAVDRLDLHGLKVHGHDAAVTREVGQAADRFGLPVLFDPAGTVAPVDLLAVEFPRVAWIIPHLGSFADDWAAQRAVIDLLARHPNVFADSSGVRRFDLLAEAVRRGGAHKLLFGSDGPWLHPGVELEKIRQLGLTPADERRVLGGNVLRLLGATEAECTRRSRRARMRPGPSSGQRVRSR